MGTMNKVRKGIIHREVLRRQGDNNNSNPQNSAEKGPTTQMMDLEIPRKRRESITNHMSPLKKKKAKINKNQQRDITSQQSSSGTKVVFANNNDGNHSRPTTTQTKLHFGERNMRSSNLSQDTTQKRHVVDPIFNINTNPNGGASQRQSTIVGSTDGSPSSRRSSPRSNLNRTTDRLLQSNKKSPANDVTSVRDKVIIHQPQVRRKNDKSPGKKKKKKQLIFNDFASENGTQRRMKLRSTPTKTNSPPTLWEKTTRSTVTEDKNKKKLKRNLFSSLQGGKKKSLKRPKPINRMIGNDKGTARAPISLEESSDEEEFDNATEHNNNNNNNEPLLTQTTLEPDMEKLKRHCWSCLAPVRHHRPTVFDFHYDDYPLYEMQEHPVLACPICAYCSLLVEATERDLGNDDGSTIYCSGCGKSEHDIDNSNLFLCDDTGDCKRAFCESCMAKSYGGGGEGHAKVLELLADNDQPWRCPVCLPPPPLLKLRDEIKVDATLHSTDEKRSIEIIMKEIDVAEIELQNCQEKLDCLEDSAEAEIRKELIELYSGDELEENVDIEMQLLRENLNRHELNVGNLIASLQEEAQLDHNVAIESIYRDGLGILHSCLKKRDTTVDEDSDHDDTDDDDDHSVPDFVRSANKEIQCREKKEGKSNFDSLDQSAYFDDDYEDVEDLSNILDDYFSMNGYSGYTKLGNRRPAKEQIDVAMKEEEEKLAAAGIRVRMISNENKDEEYARQEELEASGRRQIKVNNTSNSSSSSTTTSFARNEFKVLQKIIVSSKKEKIDKEKKKVERKKSSVIIRGDATILKMGTAGATAENTNIGIKASTSPRHSDKGTPPSSSLRHADKGTPTSMSPRHADKGTPSYTNPRFEDKGTPPNEMYYGVSNVFRDSSLVLCDDHLPSSIRTISVATRLTRALKPHQINGVKFIYKNCFSDFTTCDDGNDSLVGGCLLAHHMGLGKSLTTIALLHAVMRHPTMFSKHNPQSRLVRHVLLVAPVNTIANWEAEFEKWLGKIDAMLVYNLGSYDRNARSNIVTKWQRVGGILLTSDSTLVSLLKEQALQPQVVVLDEAHTMLKTTSTKIFQALKSIRTPRKIVLTGTPFQNNLLEYFRMINYVRPGVLECARESEFERKYAEPIMKGMTSDASSRSRYESLQKSVELSDKLRPFVDRVHESELRKVLPPMQEVVLHIRPSRLQTNLYQSYERHRRTDAKYANFFRQYAALRPIHNHPGCLVTDTEKPAKIDEKDDENFFDLKWWESIREKQGEEALKDVKNGFKIVLLLHILAYSQQLNEKVLIFSNCLKTLNYIEYVLSLRDWKEHVPSLRKAFPDEQLGGWRKSFEYLRIDGEIHSAERGDLVNQFNANDDKASDTSVRAFLLSSRAGGVGINLQAATRVVLLDNHFNPTVMTQAVCRAYRYGQTKPVYCYRFLIQGTMEAKVYSRCVNKMGLGLQVVDQKSISRNFSARELEDLQKLETWVQCDTCDKWRLLIGETPEKNLPDKWHCFMNHSDPENNNCKASEKDIQWYNNHYFGDANRVEIPGSIATESGKSSDMNIPVTGKGEDEILHHLLAIVETVKKGPLICKHVFHESLLQSRNDNDELEMARKAWQEEESVLAAKNVQRTTMSQHGNEANMSANNVHGASSTLVNPPISTQNMVQPNVTVNAFDRKKNNTLVSQTMVQKKIDNTVIQKTATNNYTKGGQSQNFLSTSNSKNQKSMANTETNLIQTHVSGSPLTRNNVVASPAPNVLHPAARSNIVTNNEQDVNGTSLAVRTINPLSVKRSRIRSCKTCVGSSTKTKDRIIDLCDDDSE